MESIAHWIGQYGYFGLFSLLILGIVGLPIPDETLLTFAGFLVYQNRLYPVPTFLSALLGSCCGISISYALGRSLGFLVIRKYGRTFHITQERMDRVHDWFSRVGTWGLLFGYFIPGVRHLTAIAAGTSKLRPLVFGLFAYSGACLWVATFMSVGYFVGDRWKQTLEEIESHRGGVIWVLLGALAIAIAVHQWSRRKKR
ncbi:MAG TPA: DedA family protein [Acidobacteriota bacterium]|nr:DedA family protein [Acidobacteriota bacterium]